MSPSARSGLFGREPEVALLRRLLEESSNGGRVAIVRGDSGSGKSALLVEASRYAADKEMMVLRAAGVESEMKMPFAGLHQLLRPALDDLDHLPQQQRQALHDAFGSIGNGPEIFLVALASLSVVGELAAHQPVAALVDDAQWLDTPTLEVLTFIARRLEADPVALLIAWREGSENSVAVTEAYDIELGRLDDKDAADLLDARFPNLDRPARLQVLELAAGNPLALVELPTTLGKAPFEQGLGGLPLTRRLERAFAVRMRDLPTPTQWLLFVLALDDRPSVDEVLSAAAKLVDQPPTLADLAPAESARLVLVDGHTLRFRHPLMRSAVHEAATTAERHAVHSALADVLMNEPTRSVWHRAACATGPDDQIAAQLEANALQTRQHHETGAALTALVRAAELSSTEARRGARLASAAELALELGRNEQAVELLDQAESLDIDVKTRHSTLWLREALAEASGTATVESMIAVAEQLLAGGEERLALHTLFTAAVRCYMFKVDERIPAMVVQVADQLPLAAGDPRLEAIYALAAPSVKAERVLQVATGRTPEELIRTSADPAAAADALHLRGLALTSLAEFRLGVSFQDAAIAALRSQGRLGVLARALGSHSVTRLVLADWQLADQAAEECLSLTGYVRGSPASAADGERVLNAGSALLVLGTVAGNRGDQDRANNLLDEAVQVMGWVGSSFCLAGVHAARASVALAAGRAAEAFDHALRIFDPTDPACHWGVSRWGTVLRDFADAALASGNARAAVAALTPFDRASGSEESQATLAYVDAVLAETDVEEHFLRALANSPVPVYFLARLDLAFAQWLRRQRRHTEARTYLRSAIDGFEGMRAAPWAERARQELRASGETVRHRLPDRRDDLSAQEMQIAELAAQGLSNKEIGERLFLSPRTIGSHLYRIFPKLGIKSRSELAVALRNVSA